MESKGVPTPSRVYQDFEPSMEWVPEDDSDTLLVYLPGFAKEQLRVQLRSRNLIISGERKLQLDAYSRFRVEFPVSANCDLNKISAKFEGNILFVRQPKVITPAAKPVEEEKPPAVAAVPPPAPQKPMHEPNVGQKVPDEKPTSPTKTKTDNNVGKDQELQKMEKTEEKSSEPIKTEKLGGREDGSEKKLNDSDKKKKMAVYGELDRTSKKALENYKRAVGVFATKLRTSRNAVNTIVVLLLGLVVGIYVSGSIRSWTKTA